MRRLGELNEPDNTPDMGQPRSPSVADCGNSTADAYLRPAMRRRNLTILTGVHAQPILLNGARATGVAYRDAAGLTQRVNASDPQRRHGEIPAAAHAVRYRRSRPAARCRRGAAP